MIQMYFAEARICCNKGTTPYTNWGGPGRWGEVAYSLVNYEFGGPRCKSRERGDCCIFQLVLKRETGVPGSC
jgi:hypothetical protein